MTVSGPNCRRITHHCEAEIGYLLQNQQKFDVNLNVRHFGKCNQRSTIRQTER
ncbi:MAG: hypothetical protein ACLRIL_02120 [Fusicatenibacter saccharivorans]